MNTLKDLINTGPILVVFKKKEIKSQYGNMPLSVQRLIIFSVEKYIQGGGLVVRFYCPVNKWIQNYYMDDSNEIEILNSSEDLKEVNELIQATLPNILSHTFMMGSDPEMFVLDKDGVVIPAWNYLGDKKHPNKTERDDNVYWDGFQAEFAPRAEYCMQGHSNSIREGLRTVIKQAKAKYPDAVLSHKTTVNIPTEMLVNAADEHVEFGCMPSFNAYGMTGMKLPGREVGFRSAGGHLHFGLGAMTKEQAEPIVKTLDAIIGVACVSLFATMDDPRRRMLYGLAGEYRLPPHGLEYRVLSNAWLCHPLITFIVVDITRKALMLSKIGQGHLWQHDEKETIRIINTCDVPAAREVLKKNKELFQKLCLAAYHGQSEQQNELLFNVFLNGAESIIQDVSKVEENWNVNRVNEWRHKRNDVMAGKKIG